MIGTPDDGQPAFTLTFLPRYWHDPAFRAAADAEIAEQRAIINTSIDAEIAKRRSFTDDDVTVRQLIGALT